MEASTASKARRASALIFQGEGKSLHDNARQIAEEERRIAEERQAKKEETRNKEYGFRYTVKTMLKSGPERSRNKDDRVNKIGDDSTAVLTQIANEETMVRTDIDKKFATVETLHGGGGTVKRGDDGSGDFADPTSVSFAAKEILACENQRIDPNQKQAYLSQAEFKKIFNMTKPEFNKMPLWKRQNLKHRLGWASTSPPVKIVRL